MLSHQLFSFFVSFVKVRCHYSITCPSEKIWLHLKKLLVHHNSEIYWHICVHGNNIIGQFISPLFPLSLLTSLPLVLILYSTGFILYVYLSYYLTHSKIYSVLFIFIAPTQPTDFLPGVLLVEYLHSLCYYYLTHSFQFSQNDASKLKVQSCHLPALTSVVFPIG